MGRRTTYRRIYRGVRGAGRVGYGLYSGNPKAIAAGTQEITHLVGDVVNSILHKASSSGKRASSSRPKPAGTMVSPAGKRPKVSRQLGPFSGQGHRLVNRPRKRFYTQGHYVGSFPKMYNKRREDKFRKYGSTTKIEHAGTSTGANVAEIGHSTSVPQLICQSMGRALFRKLFRDEIVNDWTDSPSANSSSFSYVFWYRYSPVSATEVSAPGVAGAYTAFAAGLTYAGMADVIMNAILAVIDNTYDIPTFERIRMRKGSDEQHEVDLRYAKIDIDISSILTVQNITNSDNAGNTSVTDVRANPIIGRQWISQSNSMIHTDNSGGIMADERSGLIGNLTGNYDLTKPPNYYSNAKRSGQILLQPGKIRKSSLRYAKMMSFRGMLVYLRRWCQANTSVTAAGTEAYIKFGQSKLMHFEHMVKNTADPSVTIGYELALFVKSYMTSVKNREALRIDELI